MKVFTVLIILIGFLIPSIAFAQYLGDVEFYHLSLTIESKPYSILAQSNTNHFTDVLYDGLAESLIFSTSSSEDIIDIYTITMNKQTFSELLATDYAQTPDSMLVLINGVEQPYRIFKDSEIISWQFYAPISTDEVELVPSTPRFGTGTYELDKVPTNTPRVYPPLKQAFLGISSENIQCKQNLVLIQKYDGSPACVTESTKQKLIERGWTGSITESEYSILRDILDRCEEIQRTGTFDGFAYGSSWQNETHYIDNNSCRWIYLEKYLDENNELNFALKYDNNGMIIDDLQRIYDYCDYSGKKPDWYFSWNNQTHHIDSSQCKWYGCDDGEIYYRGVCMTPEAKEKAQSVGEFENEN